MAGWHEVGVGPEGGARVGVAQVLGQSFDVYAAFQQCRGVVVPQGVGAIRACGVVDPSACERWLPLLTVEGLPPPCPAGRVGHDELHCGGCSVCFLPGQGDGDRWEHGHVVVQLSQRAVRQRYVPRFLPLGQAEHECVVHLLHLPNDVDDLRFPIDVVR